MATKIQVTDTKYFNELTNNQDFLTNTGDFSEHLLGQVGDRQRLEMTIQVSNSYNLGRYDIVGGNTIILKDGQSFLREDFYAGGKAYLSQVASANLNWEFDILSISTDGTELVATNIIEKDDTGTPTGPTIFTDGSYNNSGTNNDVLRSLVESNGLVCKFGFVPNSGPLSYASPLDNIQQAYKFDGLRPGVAPGPVITGTWDNSIQGSNTGAMTAQFIQTVTDNGVIKTGVSGATALIDSIQEFKIVQDFIIPYYEQGDFTNVQTQTPTDWIADNLKQVFEFDFRQNLSNPNVSQFGEYNTVLGNVRYYNDNYIDSAQQYSVSDVTLTVLGESVSNINASETTTVTCSINSANSTFLTTDPVLIEHSYLPNSDQYAGQNDIFTDVWLRETLRNEIDAAAVNGAIITAFTATLISAAQIDLSFNISFSIAQQTRLQEGYNFELSVKVADSSLSVPFSDVAKLIITANTYTLNTDIAGLANFPQSYVYTRPMMFPIADPLDRFTSLRGWIQDGFLYDWNLNLNLVEEATLEALTLRLVAFNTLENTWFELDNYNYDLGGQVVTVGPPDVQNISIDTTRGYDLADGDKLNFAKLQTGNYSAPNQPYTGQTAFRLSWQDWIALPNADTVFYNPAELNNGLNKQSNRYSLQNNYVICVLIDARIGKVIDGTKVITQYINRSANLEVYDFGEQDGSPITWIGNIQTFDEGGADLGGTILTEGLTTIKGTFAPDSLVTDPSLYWGEVRVERLNNPADNYYSLSTLEDGIDNNPLQAPTGSTYAKIEIVGSDVVVSADLNADLLPDSGPWNITVRMGLIDQSVPIVPIVKMQIDGNTRQIDGNFVVFQQTGIMAASKFIPQLFSLLEAVTPGTPPGWQFKVSPTNAEPGGDAYNKLNWAAISYIDFTTLALILGSESDRWVYVEADDSTKIDEGFIIEYERPQVSQNPVNLSFLINPTDIDLDRTIYFDRLITINSITFGAGSDGFVQIVTNGPSVQDWTLLDQFQGANPTTDIPTLQATINGFADGDKYGIRFFNREQDGLLTSLNFQFEYNSIDQAEKVSNFNQTDINKEFRPFTDSYYPGPFPNSDNIYSSTNAADVPLLNLLDPTTPNAGYSILCWCIPRLSSGNRLAILTPNLSAFAGGGGTQFMLDGGNDWIQVAFHDNNGVKKFLRWFGTFGPNIPTSSGRWTQFILVCDGSGDIANIKLYYNGLQMPTPPSPDVSISPNNPFNSTGVPADGFYRHGLWNNATNGNTNLERTERIQIFDKPLTPEEVRILFNEPNASRGGAPKVSNLFRDFDFANHNGVNVPELVASQDMSITTGGAAPALIPFY